MKGLMANAMVYRINIDGLSDEAYDFYVTISDEYNLNCSDFGVETLDEAEAYEIYNKAKEQFSDSKISLYYESEDYDSHNQSHKQTKIK